MRKKQNGLSQVTDREKGVLAKAPRRRRFKSQKFLMNSRTPSVQDRIKRSGPIIRENKDSPLEWIFKRVGSLLEGLLLLFHAFFGLLWQLFSNGTASPKEIEEARQHAADIRGKVSVAKINPTIDEPERTVKAVAEALRKVIDDVQGYDFLSLPPEGKKENEHTVLIKVGINWGAHGYPTVTSWESVYSVAKMCLEESQKRGAKVKVIVGDESGIEINVWGGSTRKNFEHTKMLHAAVRAGLEHATALNFPGAPELYERFMAGYPVTYDEGDGQSKEMIAMAIRAGVETIQFGNEDKNYIRVPPGDNFKHFKQGILLPAAAWNATDIINLPKPPGRHMSIGNMGLSGAMKNHVGLLKPEDRSRAFHWGDPRMAFQEKIVELYLAVRDKERFSAADMRLTVSSLGPDIGDTVDIGAVIAAKDPATLDVVAGAFLGERYRDIGSLLDALMPGGDSFWEYVAGKTWLRNCTPFDLMGHVAANSYAVGPVDLAHIDFLGLETSGFREKELDRMAEYLQPPDRRIKTRTIGRRASRAAGI